MRALALCCVLFATQAADAAAQGGGAPVAILDVPFISQSEALCGGAAAAMVLRYWGAREVFAESFADLVEPDGGGIRTDRLAADLERRGWTVRAAAGDASRIAGELAGGRPVLALIEDRPSVFHYVVVVGWHERGVVLHDPARNPFLVLSTGEFERRWDRARHWMAVVVPGTVEGEPQVLEDAASTAAMPRLSANSACDQAVARGVEQARAGDLDAAERTLAAAIGCPATLRELAGVRVLQKRWAEAADLAEAAAAADPHDAYAWKVLGTSRFIRGDRLGALEAWNEAGEPALDLVRMTGLQRTRHRVVERSLGIAPGELLTVERFSRARRRLAELPAAASSHLEYVPVPGGLVELRGVLAERPRVPTGRIWLAATALTAATRRELRLSTGSWLGGGEALSAEWRFWAGRPRVAGSFRAPAPWGGLWSVGAFSEREAFSSFDVATVERTGARLRLSDWTTDRLRWEVAGGADRWRADGARAYAGAALRYGSPADRLVGRADVSFWRGHDGFATASFDVAATSSVSPTGLTISATGGLQVATAHTPLDLWFGGDTGHARDVLLRSHPLVRDGRLRVDRLGRSLVHGSIEARRWGSARVLGRAAAAVFVDLARTGARRTGDARHDLDVGAGGRLVLPGVPGMFRVDVAKGLRDGATTLSMSYEP